MRSSGHASRRIEESISIPATRMDRGRMEVSTRAAHCRSAGSAFSNTSGGTPRKRITVDRVGSYIQQTLGAMNDVQMAGSLTDMITGVLIAATFVSGALVGGSRSTTYWLQP